MEKKINPNNSEKLAKTLSQDTYDIFISYKVTENKEEAKTLYDILHDEGYSVFWDKDKLKGGEKWNKQLEVALRNARFFFVFTTPESLNSFQEGWNEDGNDKYSYYCHEIDLITNRVNDENVYCLPLFTDSLQVIRNYNEFFKRDNTARKCIDTLSECEGHAYSKLDGNTTFRSGLIEYIYKQLSNVGIFPFYKKSRDVITGELFYDPKRASSEQGFKAGSRYYVKRSIDNSISNFASMQDENSFLFISGRPGSGKTRALYEWLHSPSMENENVVVLNRHTIRPVYEKLMKFKSSSFEFSSTNKSLYFVCDQVNDVFNFLTSEEQLKFLSVIYSKQYKFVGTDTPYDNDIFLHKINISDWPYKIVHIKDLTEDEIREFQFVYGYKNNDNKKKIAADFVELLRAHKNKVINNIYKYDQENAIYGQLRVFLRVVQIAKEILKKNDLESIRNLLNGIFPGRFDDSVIVRLLNILSFPEYGISILDLGVSEKLTVYELFLSVDNYNVNIYDDLAWEMMQTRLDGNENILYDLYSLKDTQAICNIFNKCDLFDNPAYNYMLFYNLPFKNRNEELNDYYSRCDVMRNYIIGRIDKWKNNHKWDTNDRDFRTLVSAITERSVNIKQIDQSIKLLPVTDAKSIRSLYKIAKTWHLNPGDEKQFEGFDNLLVEQTDKYHNTNSVSFDDISRIHYEIDSHYKTLSFEDCYNQCKPLMDHDFLNEDCNHRDLDFLFTDLASLCKKSEDFDHFWAFFDSVAQKMCSYMMSVYTAKAIAKSISRFFYGKKYAENERQLLSRLISHIPVVIKFGSIVDVENRQLYLMYISRIILVQRCFYTSFCIYEEARKKLGMAEKGDHELRIISLCLKNCQANEFSMAVVYIVNLSVEDKRIFYNILIRKAPTQEEAYYILRFLSKEGTDSYTLSNCLKKVENVSFIPTSKIEKDLAKIHDENECREQMEWLKMNIEEDDKILLDDAYAVLKRIPFKERKKWQQSLLLFFEGKERGSVS
ncbi:toll/interleukin-1 receptor domain-containing protein [Xylanibacter ruminicola]|uniref:TIR domain-containing protein n=1 Tax=Xylanibacter ruminicola TaxID=839 RepID=A0A1M6XAK1_XYLRU|nr:toll/interleukin-1 receptor domain-containing protein [Xylanibacter ruminicola]SHL02976.1 TIR domain-containing protein [Xylanibacter ruminicola]